MIKVNMLVYSYTGELTNVADYKMFSSLIIMNLVSLELVGHLDS